MFHESSFTNVGRRCETPGSEPKGFITNNAARSMSFKFLSVPLASKVPWGQHKGPRHAAQAVGLCYMWGILRLGTSSLLFGCKQPCLPFAPERDIIFVIMNSKTACPLLQWEALSLSSKAVHFTDILEKIAHHQCLCWQDVRKCERHMENCIPTSSKRFRYYKFISL